MNIDEISGEMQKLSQYEIDTSYCLSEVIDSLNNQTIREKLISIKKECEENISKLFELTLASGRQPLAHRRDLKGFIMQEYTMLKGLAGDASLLLALDNNDLTLLKMYEQVLTFDLPDKFREEILKLQDRCKQHLEYLNDQLQKTLIPAEKNEVNAAPETDKFQLEQNNKIDIDNIEQYS